MAPAPVAQPQPAVVTTNEKGGQIFPGCDIVYPSAPGLPPAYAAQEQAANQSGSDSEDSILPPPTLVKPEPELVDKSLDENGFTKEELEEHQRSLAHLRALRVVFLTRWFIRAVSVVVSLISFALIVTTVVLFVKSGHKQGPHDETDAWGQVDNVDITPSKAFASIGGVFTILSLTINVLCCFSRRVRRITRISNVIFAVVSIVSLTAWLSGCFYLHRNSHGRNLWYYVCSATTVYDKAKYDNADPPLNHDAQGLNFVKMCRYTEKSWDLGILQAVFEILTLINVIIAILVVKWGYLMMMLRKRTGGS